jgi:hypothetical protein
MILFCLSSACVPCIVTFFGLSIYIKDCNNISPDKPFRPNASLSKVNMSEQDVKDIHQSLQQDKTRGDDNNSNHQIIKATPETVCKVFTILFKVWIICKYTIRSDKQINRLLHSYAMI